MGHLGQKLGTNECDSRDHAIEHMEGANSTSLHETAGNADGALQQGKKEDIARNINTCRIRGQQG